MKIKTGQCLAIIACLWLASAFCGEKPASVVPVSSGYYNAISQGSAVLFRNGRELALEPDERAFVPFLGHAVFLYRKAGSLIVSRDSHTGKELFTLRRGTYPVSDHRGRILLLTSGDNTRADVLRRDGERVAGFSGRFLTHISFASRRSAALLTFSEGVARLVFPEGRTATHVEKESVFLKTGALSPAGRFVALHFFDGESDMIRLFETTTEEGKRGFRKRGEVPLHRAYPHMLHFAVSEHGLLVAAPDFAAFYGPDGEERWKRVSLGDLDAVYRPVYADRDFFVRGEGGTATVLDRGGAPVAALRVDGEPWRVLPGMEERVFAIQNGQGVGFFRFVPAD